MCARLADVVNKLSRTGGVIEQVICNDVDVNLSVDVVLDVVKELDNYVVGSGIDTQGFDRRRLKCSRLNKHD